jgi:putative ABC transport system permease protein
MLGISIGIAAFVTLTSISRCLESQVVGILNDYRVDIVLQAKGVSSPKNSRIPVTDCEQLHGISGIGEVTRLIMGTALVGSTESIGLVPTIAIGVSSMESMASKIDIVAGEMLIPGAKEIMLGKQIAEELECSPDSQAIVNEVDFRIAGIVDSGSKVFDSAAVMAIEDARELLKLKDYVNLVFITVLNKEKIKSVIKEIEKTLPSVSAYQVNEFIGQNKLLNTVKNYTKLVALLTLVISSIVVMNTLIMAISERKKEIGILLAVGWSRTMIMRTIVAESILLCTSGGLFGTFIGLGLIWFFQYNSRITGSLWLKIPVQISIPQLFEAVGLAVILGIISSIYPAIIASRQFPINALRNE